MSSAEGKFRRDSVQMRWLRAAAGVAGQKQPTRTRHREQPLPYAGRNVIGSGPHACCRQPVAEPPIDRSAGDGRLRFGPTTAGGVISAANDVRSEKARSTASLSI